MKKAIVITVWVLVLLGITGGAVSWYIRRNTGFRLLARADVALAADQFQIAAELAETYVARRPDDWRGHRIQGLAYMHLGRYDSAREAFQQWAGRKPGAIEPRMATAGTYSKPARVSLATPATQLEVNALTQAVHDLDQANEILSAIQTTNAKDALNVREEIGLNCQAIAAARRRASTRLAEAAHPSAGADFRLLAFARREASTATLAQADRAEEEGIKALLDVVVADPSRADAARALVTMCIRRQDEESLEIARKAIVAHDRPPAIAAMMLATHEMAVRSRGKDAAEQRELLRNFCGVLDRLLVTHPDEAELKLARGQAALRLDDHPMVERMCTEILKTDSSSGRAEFLRAKLRMRQKKFAEAERLLSRLKIRFPRHVEIQLAFAQACLANGRTDMTLQTMRTITELDPGHVVARRYLAETLLRYGFFGKAFEDAWQYWRAHPEHPRALRLLVAAVAQSRNHKPALAALEKAQADHSDRAEMMLAVAEGYDRLGLDGKAQEAYNKAVACKADSLEARLAVAQAMVRTGRLPEAEKLLTEELSRNPDHPWVRFELGRLCSQTGRSLQAAEHYRTAVRLDEANPYLRLALAQTWLDSGNLERCRDVLEQIDAEDAEANLMRLQVKLLRGEAISGVDVFQQIKSMHRAGGSLAMAYLNSGQPERCVDVCLDKLRITPGDKELHFLLGQAYLAMGRKDKCLKHWSLLVQAFPDKLPVYFLIADLLDEQLSAEGVRGRLNQIPGSRLDFIDMAVGRVLTRQGEFGAAAALYQGLSRHQNATVFTRRYARLLRASALYSAGDVEAAVAELDELGQNESWRAAALESKADILLRSGRHDQAETVLARLR